MTRPDQPAAPKRSLPARIVRTWAIPLVLGGLLATLWIVYVNRSDGSSLFAETPKPSPIDGDRAYGYLKTICNFGPRKAGSDANTKQRNYVAAHFKKMGATLTEQKFSAPDPLGLDPAKPNKRGPKALKAGQVQMVNLVASWNPDRADRVVIAAHYDTRPFPDQEAEAEDRRRPFLGANDGASGVALLMEIAHHLNDSPTPWGVDLVIFDGEELVYEDENGLRAGEMFLGSNEFSRLYKLERKKGTAKYVAGIVLDMVGDKELEIPVEASSRRLAPNLVKEVWGIADKLNARGFVQNLGKEVYDDHLSMNAAGIPTIDIIDFDYPFWHKAGDLPEECSGKSLAEVGRVVTAWLNQPKAARSKKR